MNLPDLATQIVYGRLGWAIVLATVLAALWSRVGGLSRTVLAAIVGGTFLLNFLPGELAPSWWLGLAFQYPSGLLVGCCVLRLAERWSGIRRSAVMPQALAGALAVAGTLLYLDAMGVLARGFYYAGFGSAAVGFVTVIAAGACALAILRGHARGHALALLGAIALFSLLRLPSGNLWDALLDPLLWGWAVATLLAGAVRVTGRRASDRLTVIDADSAATPGLHPTAAAAAKQ